MQAQVLNMMKDLRRRFGRTCLFISHKLAVARDVSDEVGIMYLRRLVALANQQEQSANPRHPCIRIACHAVAEHRI